MACKVWLDCDPGHDDAMAIILAAYTSGIELLGISTVAGNQTVQKTTRNARLILAVSGLEGKIEVVQGQAQPLLRPCVVCPEIHGDSGLDNNFEGKLPPHALEERHDMPPAAVRMFEVISSCPLHSVTLVATACLTNIALLLTLYPEVTEYLEKIVILGGAQGRGNVSPVAEFNILIDPEAAKIVFDHGALGVRIVLITLETTHTCLVTPAVLAQINERLGGSPYCRFIESLLLFFKESYARVFRFLSPPLHDPLAVAFAAAPELFTLKKVRVDIETASMLSAGQTVFDLQPWLTRRPENIELVTGVNVEGFWKMMLDALARANERSCLNASAN